VIRADERLIVVVLCAFAASACDDPKAAGSAAATSATAKAASADSKPATTATPTADSSARAAASAEAPPAEKAPAEDKATAFWSGDAPEGVDLAKGTSAPNYNYTVKYPADWQNYGLMGGNFMVTSKDNDAAFACVGDNGNPVTLKELESKLKAAPIKGSDVKLEGERSVVEVGKAKFHARVGFATANLFGEPDGEVYFLDMGETNSGADDHLVCFAALKKGAPEDRKKELQAMAHNLGPRSGTNLWKLVATGERPAPTSEE
jgi:hypothetical protein